MALVPLDTGQPCSGQCQMWGTQGRSIIITLSQTGNESTCVQLLANTSAHSSLHSSLNCVSHASKIIVWTHEEKVAVGWEHQAVQLGLPWAQSWTEEGMLSWSLCCFTQSCHFFLQPQVCDVHKGKLARCCSWLTGKPLRQIPWKSEEF